MSVQVLITAEGTNFNVQSNAAHVDQVLALLERAKFILLAGSTSNIKRMEPQGGIAPSPIAGARGPVPFGARKVDRR